jgi:hypothetical protein
MNLLTNLLIVKCLLDRVHGFVGNLSDEVNFGIDHIFIFATPAQTIDHLNEFGNQNTIIFVVCCDCDYSFVGPILLWNFN